MRWFPGLALKVFWDDETEPSIQAPLSDFFGAMGGKTIDYQSAPMQINHACYACYLPMPFSRRARFVLANDGDRDYSQSVAYGIDYEEGAAFAQEKSRLHCAWHRSNPVKNGLHTLLDARGRGHYVGGFLQVHTQFRGWRGEGDTIFELDGQPMTHTPGTEDEYGSCWGFEHTYSISELKIIPAPNVAPPPDTNQSARIKGLKTSADVAAFWKEIGPEGSPLIESIKDDPKNRLVTFLWRGGEDTSGVLLYYRPCIAENPETSMLRRLPGTDLWYKSVPIDSRARTYYTLASNPPAFTKQTFGDPSIRNVLEVLQQRDPLNPKSSCGQTDSSGRGSDDWQRGARRRTSLQPGLRRLPQFRVGSVASAELPRHFRSTLGDDRRFELRRPGGGLRRTEASGDVRQCPFAIRMFIGGHDYLSWRETLADGLILLLGPLQ